MQEMQGMQDDMQMPSFEMPDISATLAKFTTGASSSSTSPQIASGKKRQSTIPWFLFFFLDAQADDYNYRMFFFL
jgi:hypothetical protein